MVAYLYKLAEPRKRPYLQQVVPCHLMNVTLVFPLPLAQFWWTPKRKITECLEVKGFIMFTSAVVASSKCGFLGGKAVALMGPELKAVGHGSQCEQGKWV